MTSKELFWTLIGPAAWTAILMLIASSAAGGVAEVARADGRDNPHCDVEIEAATESKCKGTLATSQILTNRIIEFPPHAPEPEQSTTTERERGADVLDPQPTCQNTT